MRCDRFLYYSGMTCIVAVPGPGLGLERGLVPLLEPGPIGTLRCRHRVAESVLVVPPRPELAPALVPGSWTELVKVRWQNLPQRGSELPSASPAREQARPWPLLLAF